MSLLVFHQFSLQSLLDKDLVAQTVNHILLALHMIVVITLQFLRELRRWQMVTLQSLNQVYYANAVILFETRRCKVYKLLAFVLTHRLCPVLGKQLRSLILIEKV